VAWGGGKKSHGKAGEKNRRPTVYQSQIITYYRKGGCWEKKYILQGRNQGRGNDEQQTGRVKSRGVCSIWTRGKDNLKKEKGGGGGGKSSPRMGIIR